jgi:hypothetical protein
VLVLVLAVIAGLDDILLSQLQPAPVRWFFDLLSAGFLGVGLSYFSMIVSGRSRGLAMLRRAHRGETPEDREEAIATGVVRALSAPLTAPLSGISCVCYTYSMYTMKWDPAGDQQTIHVFYCGAAARPFAIDSITRRVGVLAVPTMTWKAESRRGEEAVERARRFIDATSFERKSFGSALSLAADLLGKAFPGGQAEVRHDWKREGVELDPATLILEETVLATDVEASVHGTWSEKQGAIVGTESPSGHRGVSVALGPPEGLPDAYSTGGYLVPAFVFTGLWAVVMWLARLGVR